MISSEGTELMDFSIVFSTICLTVSTICAIISCGASIYAIIEVKSMQRSTHTVQWTPIDPKWASSEEDLNKMTNPGKEELPELDPDEIEESDLDLRKMI